MTPRIIGPVHVFNGAVGSFDTVHVMLDLSGSLTALDFVSSTFSSVERIVIDSGATAAIYSNQFNAGELSTSLQINDGTGAGRVIISVNTPSLDMTGFTGTINDLRVFGSSNAIPLRVPN